MTLRIKIKVDKRLKKKIEQSLSDAALQTVRDIKAELRQHLPEIYQDRKGELSNILQSASLEPQSGALLKAWRKTINNIRRTQLKNSITFSLFTSKYLDEGTPWIGITNPPVQTKYSKPQLSDNPRGKIRKRDYGIFDYGGVIVNDNGYRPLPSTTATSTNGKGTRFTWHKNPYPNYGYWLLYEQGYFNDNINYPSHNFIKDAYRPILGNSVNGLISTQNINLRLSDTALRNFNKRIKENINKKVNI